MAVANCRYWSQSAPHRVFSFVKLRNRKPHLADGDITRAEIFERVQIVRAMVWIRIFGAAGGLRRAAASSR